MNINFNEFCQQLFDEIKNAFNNLKTLNIIVIGKTGSGKSTLINGVFRGNFAETGLGKPVTSKIRKIEKKDYPLVIYDTPGFEMSSSQQKNVKDEILHIIQNGITSNNINDAIHCIWYCINVGANRLDESEVKWVKEFAAENKTTHVPIIVVLTQAAPKRKAEEMKQLVEGENLPIVKVVPVLAEDMPFDEEYVARSYGLDNLIKVMLEILPEELKKTLLNMEKADLESKINESRKAVYVAAGASAFAGVSPIPFSDAAILIPIQVGMIVKITTIFGLDIDKGFLTAFVSATIGCAGATVLGKTAVSTILKCVPVVGTIAGGAISATTAGLLTTALGEAYIQIMVKVYKGELSKEDLCSEVGKEKMIAIFKGELENKS